MYVYRFTNSNNEIIYIGKAKDLKNRISNHNHLPKQCYEERVKIEYIICLNDDESSIYERYLINKLSPKYNTQYDNKSGFSFELPEKEWIDYNKLDEVKVNKVSKEDYDKMSLKERIKYHKSIGDVVCKVRDEYIVYKKETLEKRRDECTNLYNNCYRYNNINKVFEILCSFDNRSSIYQFEKEYKPKRLFYISSILYTTIKEIKYEEHKSYMLIIYDIENDNIKIYFHENYYIEMRFKESVEKIRDVINNTQEYICNNILCNLEYENFVDGYYWKNIIDWWKEDFKIKKESELLSE